MSSVLAVDYLHCARRSGLPSSSNQLVPELELLPV